MKKSFITSGPGHLRNKYQNLTGSQVTTIVKPVLSRHSKIDKTHILKTNGSLMKVESIADPLGAFCNTFDLH